MEGITRETLPTIVLLAAFAATLCFVPCVLFGTISPIVVKLAVNDLGQAGRVVGRIYAAGAIGSIVGTFATGFFLLSWLGTHVVIWSVAALFLLLSLPMLLHRLRLWMILSVLLIAGASWLAFGRGWLDGPCTSETHYFCIIVRDDEINGRPDKAFAAAEKCPPERSLAVMAVCLFSWIQPNYPHRDGTVPH